MSKKFIGGLALGLVVPIVAGGVCIGVPSVRDRLFKSTNNDSELQLKIDELEKSNNSLKNENTELKNNNNTLSGKVNSLTGELETTKNSIKLKDEQITNKENQINTLTQEKASLQSELDRIKALVGQDINYLELVTSLQSQLEEKTTALTTATAELEQLRVDKTTLETRVSELETELTQVKEELSNYKSIGEIDKLNISNFNGTWYLDGTFADYYTIENGVVTHNANEDKGLLNVIYNQMYIMLNSAGGKAVELSSDGTSFTTADGNTYTKFYTNTLKSVVPVYTFAGTYNNGTNVIKVNADNTISLTSGDNTYNGAYTVTTIEKNVGGNITNLNTITATYQIDGQPIVKTYTNTSKDNFIISDGLTFVKTSGINGHVCRVYSGKTNNPDPIFTFSSSSKGLKVVIRTAEVVKGASSGSDYFKFGVSKTNTYIYVNGCNLGSYDYISGKVYFDSDYNPTNIFTFYFYPSNSMYLSYCKDFGLKDIFTAFGVDCQVIDMEYINCTFEEFPVAGNLKRIYDLKQGNSNTVSCASVDAYTNGTYIQGDNSIVITDGVATVNGLDAKTCDITATTDGTDIYQTVKISYIETVDEVETTHNVVLNFKNDVLISSTLDNVEATFTKN